MSHRGRVITQADVGSTLAQLYDTVGSRSGGPQAEIQTDDIYLVHEMGHLAFAERFFTRFRTISGVATQSSNIDEVATNFPPNFRIQLVGIYIGGNATDATDIANVAVLLRESPGGREFPIFGWDSATGDSILLRYSDGSGVNNRTTLINQLPSLQYVGQGSNRPGIFQISVKGTTAAFGTGTRSVNAILAISGASHPVGAGESGYPIPSW